ncbi:MAG: diguanylate cyclase [Synergistaceae bacterium]|jgi:diguanylate cyclase (GGDEF)-like protein|nr:diguanylate cyclase [Synergistaceae bacterium]
MANYFRDRNKLIILIFLLITFACSGAVSLALQHYLTGSTKFINYIGLLRGTTQRLVKKELMHYPDDEMLSKLENLVNGLREGGRGLRLNSLTDRVFRGNMEEVTLRWEELRNAIMSGRETGKDGGLYLLSEAFFDLVDRTATSAMIFFENTQRQAVTAAAVSYTASAVLAVCGIAAYVQFSRMTREKDMLGRVAYFDPMVKIPNRASCKREISEISANPPDGTATVFVFDMNNVTLANEIAGQQAGDRIIADFGGILKEEGEPFGFVGRFGGDEFLALFRECAENTASAFLKTVNERVLSYNLLRLGELEKISFVVGFVTGNPAQDGIEGMVDLAGKIAYDRKREMRKG